MGFEPTYVGFANRCLTTWLPHPTLSNHFTRKTSLRTAEATGRRLPDRARIPRHTSSRQPVGYNPSETARWDHGEKLDLTQ